MQIKLMTKYIYSLLEAAVEEFNLPDDFIMESIDMLFVAWTNPHKFENIDVELIALAALQYICDEDMYIEKRSFDNFIIKQLGVYDSKTHILGYARAYQHLTDLYDDFDDELEIHEVEKHINRTRRGS